MGGEMRPQSHPNGYKRGFPLREEPKGSSGGVRRDGGEIETPKPPQWVQEGLPIKGGAQRIFWGGQKGMGGN